MVVLKNQRKRERNGEKGERKMIEYGRMKKRDLNRKKVGNPE